MSINANNCERNLVLVFEERIKVFNGTFDSVVRQRMDFFGLSKHENLLTTDG